MDTLPMPLSAVSFDSAHAFVLIALFLAMAAGLGLAWELTGKERYGVLALVCLLLIDVVGLVWCWLR